jgi:hypothetical protein
VYGLTGVSEHEWALLLVLAVSAYLIAAALFGLRPALPIRRRRLLLLVASGVMLAVSLLRFGEWLVSPTRIVTRPWALVIAGAIVILAVAAGDLFVGRAARLFKWLFSRLHLPEGIAGVAALSASLLILLASAVGGLEAIEAASAPATAIQLKAGARLVASYPMPGNVTDIAFLGERVGFLSLAEGRIMRFSLPEPPEADLGLITVAEGLHDPRGLAILDRQLFVAALGPLPCPPTYQFCDGSVLGPSPEEGELEILESSRGQVLAFDIDASGALSNERVVLDGLPVVTSWHGVNGLTVGPDGLLYLTIGGLDLSWQTPDAIEGSERPNLDLLGAVVRMTPDGREVEVFARGLRNVYGIDFDERGALYGADNNGPTIGGWRMEELLQIRQGGNYGYPSEGTFGVHRVRTDGPLWLLESSGSGGIAWRGRFGLSPGLLVGSCSTLVSVRLSDLDGGQQLSGPGDVTVIMDQIEGCVTAIEPGPDGLALVGVFSWCIWCTGPTADTHPLLLIDLGNVM